MFGASLYSTSPTSTSWAEILRALWKFVSWQGIEAAGGEKAASGVKPRAIDENNFGKDPKLLAQICKELCDEMLKVCEYPGAPEPDPKDAEELLEYMYQKAVAIGLPLTTNISNKGFKLGFAMAIQAYPNHPLRVKGFIGIFTWLVVQYDDIVGQSAEMMEDALLFNDRFFRGERQGNTLLEGLAGIIREATEHFDPVLANLVQVSALKFLVSNTLEQHKGFVTMQVHRGDGERFPGFLREMSGIGWGYAIFTYPKALYPDASKFMEAIPDMARFIDIANDVISFYKEELCGEKRNYIHNTAASTGKTILAVLEETNRDSIECVRRTNSILKGQGIYEQAWRECLRGYFSMHTTNPRYKMAEFDLAEPHPLAGYSAKFKELFARQQIAAAATANSGETKADNA